MKDQTGQTVMTGLNEEMCRQLAQAGGGAYIHVENNSSAQDQLDAELEKLAKKEIESTIYSDYDEQFQAVAIIAMLLLILEVCLLEVKNPMLRHLSLFKRKKVATVVCLLLTATAVMAQGERQLVRQGNKQFRAGNGKDAEVSYRKAVEKNPRNPQANYNLGNALLLQQKDSSAVAQFEMAAKLEPNPLRRAQAYHNMGVVCQGKRMYGEAIEAYKEALRNNPADDETRYNLALCKRQQKQQQDQQQQKQDKDQQDKDKQQQQQQKQEQQQKKQEQQQQKMSRENAEQLLNAAMQEEKQTQQRMKKAQQQPNRRQLEKNW
jgi:Ca-activated chloride channel family protein